MGWSYAGDVTSGLGAVPGAASTPIGYVFAARGTEHVTYMALDFALWELTRSAELWTATNLLAAVGLPALDDPSNAKRYRDAGPNATCALSLSQTSYARMINDFASVCKL